MKILMLTPYFPYPPHSGGQTRSFNLIKFLGRRHQITLFSLIKDEKERAFTGELKKYCKKVKVFNRPAKPWTFKNILRTGFSSYPFLVVRNFSPEFKRAVEQELKMNSFDLVHAENFYVMPYIPKIKKPVLLAEQTIFYRGYLYFVQALPWYLFWLKPILMIDIWKLRYWESFFWKKADYLLAVSEEDSRDIKLLAPAKKVHIVPNGVDCDFFSRRVYLRNKFPTVFFGNADFHWMENKEGANILIRYLWPMIKREIKNARLLIGGKVAPTALAKFSGLRDVTIKEFDDSREGYQKAWVEVAPLKSGGGSRTKFFEAMAAGLPIVTTPQGAQGISAGVGEEIIMSDDLSVLAQKTIEFLRNPDLLEKIGLKAQKLAHENYSWQKSALVLDKVYQNVKNIKN